MNNRTNLAFVIHMLLVTTAMADFLDRPAQIPPISFNSRCQRLVAKVKESAVGFVQNHNAWLRRALGPVIQQRLINESMAPQIAINAGWAALNQHPDPSVKVLFKTVRQWRDVQIPTRSQTNDSFWLAFSPRRDPPAFFARTVGKYQTFAVGSAENTVVIDIRPTSSGDGGWSAEIKIGFSSAIAAGAIGTLIDSALSKTNATRGRGLPLVGGTWQLDFMRKHQHTVTQNVLHEPKLAKDYPAILLKIPMLREARGYELFLAHLVNATEQARSNNLYMPEVPTMPFAWTSSEYKNFAQRKRGTANNATGNIGFGRALSRLNTAIFNGQTLHTIAHTLMTNSVFQETNSPSQPTQVTVRRFPEVTPQELDRVLHAQSISVIQ